MDKYTLDDVRILASIYEEKVEPSFLSDEDIEKYGGSYSYIKLIETIIKEKETPENSLMEFIGSYESAVYDSKSWQQLHSFLFDIFIDEMPTFINDKEHGGWRSKVAQWRLKVRK